MQIRIFFLSLFLAFAAPAITAQKPINPGRKTTFSNKDIFHSAVFLQNTNILDNQTGEDILYYADHEHINAYFTEKGIIYQLNSITPEKEAEAKERKNKTGEEDEKSATISSSVVRMDWVGANQHPEIIAADKDEGYHTCLKKDGDSYKTLTTYGYKSLTYKDIYPGIDAVYSFPEKGGMKYNLVVHPGADVSVVRFKYSGHLKSLHKNAAGDVVVHTESGDIIEHAPICYNTFLGEGERTPRNMDAMAVVASSYTIKNNTIQFNFPNGYDRNRGMTIDPWITLLTTIPPENIGFDVDYDAVGNLFIYGAGPTGQYDPTNFFQVAKYDNAGIFQWAFTCNITSITWNSFTTLGSYSYASNFIVDKVSGEVYIGQGWEPSNGARAVRLNTSGQWDNFVSAVNINFTEIWGFAYNCATAELLALGGGTTSDLTMGVIDESTGTVATSNITGLLATYRQDILAGAYDSSGSLYVILNSDATVLPYSNSIYKVNNTYNGYTWVANTNYTTFLEAENAPFWTGAASNWCNALAANGDYLFYYDGYNLSAYNFTTGAVVGNPTTISGYTPMMQSGVAVDYCNHVYLGGIGVIKTFTFDGTNFIAGADIALGGAYSSDAIHDVKYDATSNLLYITGTSVVGTVTAALSTTCNPTGSYTVSTSATCNSAAASITPSANLNPKVFTYIWTDSTGTVVSQLSNTTDTTDTITGLSQGTYHLQVQWNSNCGGLAFDDSAVISCTTSLNLQNVTICPGQQATLTAQPSVTGGTYIWSPGGATSASITVTPATSTTYTVTYTPPTGPAVTDSARVTVTQNLTLSINTASVCPGDSVALTGTPSVTGGTYIWSPGGATTGSIEVSPAATTNYSLTYTLGSCSATSSSSVTVFPDPLLALQEVGPHCVINNGVIYVTGSGGTGPYQYALDNGAYQVADSFTNLTAGNYAVTIKDANGCLDTAATSLAAGSNVSITLITDSADCTGANGQIVATGNGGVPPYQYSLNNGPYQASGTFGSLSTGAYAVEVQDAQGCLGSANTTIFQAVGNPPVLVADSALCNGSATGQIIATASTGVAPYQFSLNNGPWQTSGTFSNLAAGAYSVQVKDANNCTSTGNVSVLQPVVVSVSGTSTDASCFGYSDGGITISITGGTPPYTFAWSDASTAQNRTQLSAGNYGVTVDDSHNCTASASYTIGQPTQLQLGAAFIDPSCIALPPDGSVNLLPNGGSSPYQYVWSNGAVTQNIQGLQPGNYLVTITDAHSCTMDTSVALAYLYNFSVSAYPTASIALGKSIGLNYTVNGTAGSYTALWDPASSLSCATCVNPVAGPVFTTTYTIEITNTNGCTAFDTITVTVVPDYDIFVPNVFSPNNDGDNDFFEVFGNKETWKFFEVQIFDRWGEKVYESEDMNFKWDGTFKGFRAPMGVYVYQMKLVFINDYTENLRKGSVTLVR